MARRGRVWGNALGGWRKQPRIKGRFAKKGAGSSKKGSAKRGSSKARKKSSGKRAAVKIGAAVAASYGMAYGLDRAFNGPKNNFDRSVLKGMASVRKSSGGKTSRRRPARKTVSIAPQLAFGPGARGRAQMNRMAAGRTVKRARSVDVHERRLVSAKVTREARDQLALERRRRAGERSVGRRPSTKRQQNARNARARAYGISNFESQWNDPNKVWIL